MGQLGHIWYVCCLITKSSLDAATTEERAPGLGTCAAQNRTKFVIIRLSRKKGVYIDSRWTLTSLTRWLKGVRTAICVQGVGVPVQEVHLRIVNSVQLFSLGIATYLKSRQMTNKLFDNPTIQEPDRLF